MNIDLLKRLCEIPGIPGREERVRAAIETEVDGLFDEMEVDPLGSLICRRNATRKTRGRKSAGTVLIAAHMDEIGFYVRHVDEHGFLWVTPPADLTLETCSPGESWFVRIPATISA